MHPYDRLHMESELEDILTWLVNEVVIEGEDEICAPCDKAQESIMRLFEAYRTK